MELPEQVPGAERSQFALLRVRRFLPFFLTQFFGAFNDNLFRNALVVSITYGATAAAAKAGIVANVAQALFILPFFLFSALAGQLAEVELAILELADAGQSVAEGVETVGLGLEFADAGGDGVHFALGFFAGQVQSGLLLFELGLEPVDLGEGGAVGASRQVTQTEGGGQHQRDGAKGDACRFRLIERQFFWRSKEICCVAGEK